MQFFSIKASCANCRLSELCLAYGLCTNDIERLAIIVKNKQLLQADETLYGQGQKSQNLYAVKSGSFRSFILNAEGVEQTIGFYFPGEIMGLDALENACFTSTAVAMELSSTCEVPLSRLTELCHEIPNLQSQLMRIVGKEIASDHEKIVSLCHQTARQRTAAFLIMLSIRHEAIGLSKTCFNLSMRRQDIANFLGLTIETVSRQLTQLNKQGVITIKHRTLQINDLDSLSTLVTPCPTSFGNNQATAE